MSTITSHQTSKGTALIFSLLILLIMTIIGVSVMSSTHMQERMAGNASLQAQAFEAASAGISDALRYGMNQFFGDPESDTNFDPRCTIDALDGKGSPWVPKEQGNYTQLGFMDSSVQTAVVEYKLRADCFRDPGLENAFPAAEGYVTSEGRVRVGDQVVASREVEVRVDDFRTDGLSALRIEGDGTLTFGAANSKTFKVDGQGGPAISASNLDNAKTIADQISDAGRLANYDGGVGQSSYDSPFNSASQLARFALEIRAFLEADDAANNAGNGQNPPVNPPVAACNKFVIPSDQEEALKDFIDTFGKEYTPALRFVDGNLNVTGGGDVDGLTYVTGNLNMGPVSSAGMIIVEGTVQWHGNADFSGVVIALGGEFVFKGLGNGVTKGMIFVTNIALRNLDGKYQDMVDDWGESIGEWGWVLDRFNEWGDPSDLSDFGGGALIDSTHPLSDDGFGSSLVDFAGGGNHTVTYSCALFDGWRQVLEGCAILSPHERADGLQNVGLAEPWGPNVCNRPGEGGSIQAIRSWRENLGWRELLTGT